MAHFHLLVRAEVHRPLLTPERAAEFLRAAVALAGMNVIAGPIATLGVVPGNEGVSATAILDFSSVNLHEWPTHRPALIQFDLYTCGKPPSVRAFRDLFERECGVIRFDARLIDRDEFLRDAGFGPS
jgi:S-adenosylmethionine/arginine decarboxylase-like enzyme